MKKDSRIVIFIKYLLVLFLWLILFKIYEEPLATVWKKDGLRFGSKITQSLQVIVNGSTRAPSEYDIKDTLEDTIIENYQTPTEPVFDYGEVEVSSDVVDLVTSLNNSINEDLLQDYLLEYIGGNLQKGDYLKEGTDSRLNELQAGNYFNTTTIEGEPFSTQHNQVLHLVGELSEVIYELNLSSKDIRLETWHNTQILAKYIYDEVLSKRDLNKFSYMHVAASFKVNPLIGTKTPYVRLVVVATFDTA